MQEHILQGVKIKLCFVEIECSISEDSKILQHFEIKSSAVSGSAKRAAMLQGVWAGAPWWGDNTIQDIHILLTN